MAKRKKTLTEIIARARELRREGTVPEIFLWSILRNRQVENLRIRRQHDVPPYVVDFYCPEAKLVIELDGESHVGRANYDDRRTAFLMSEGVSVIRFTNDEVLQSIEAVVDAIARAAQDRVRKKN